LMDHGKKRHLPEIFDLFRSAMRIQHALPYLGFRLIPSNSCSSCTTTLLFSTLCTTFPSRLRHDLEQSLLLGQRGILPLALVDRYVKGIMTFYVKSPTTNLSLP
jgi:hypothetical protein